VIASPNPALPGYIVPAGPILALVADRQRRWGFSDADMRAYLGPECAMRDARGVLSRRQAEAILRRLLAPARGNARTAKTAHLVAVAEAWQGVSPTVRERITAELAGRKPSPKPTGEA
jgi:hypothetical protein